MAPDDIFQENKSNNDKSSIRCHLADNDINFDIRIFLQ